MTSPFKPKYGVTSKAGIPGVGSQPGKQDFYEQFSFDDLTEGMSKPGKQEVYGVPAEEYQAMPGGYRESLKRTAEAPEYTEVESGVEIPTFDALTQGMSVPYENFAGDPFARQKRELRALGVSPEMTAKMDSFIHEMRELRPDKRARYLNDIETNLRGYWGMNDEEIMDLRSQLGIIGVEPYESFQEKYHRAKQLEYEGSVAFTEDVGRIAKKAAGAAVDVGVDIAKESIKRGKQQVMDIPGVQLGFEARKLWETYVTPQQKRLGPPLQKAGRYVIKHARRGKTSVEYAKDMIRAGNWKGITRLANKGDFPTMQELGEEFVREQIALHTEGATDVQKRAIQKILGNATINPSSSWYRRGEVPQAMTPAQIQELREEHGNIAGTAMGILGTAFVAPFEEAQEYLTKPENWDEIVIMYLSGKYVIRPITKDALKYLMTKRWMRIPIKQAWTEWRTKKAYEKGARIIGEISEDDVIKFIRRMKGEKRSTYSGDIDPDVKEVLQFIEDGIGIALDEDEMMKLTRFFKFKKPGLIQRFNDPNAKSIINLMIPKDMAATDILHPQHPLLAPTFVPTASKGLLPPPPIGGTKAAEAAARAAFIPRTTLAVPYAAGSVPDSQAAAAAVGSRGEIVEIPPEMRISPTEIGAHRMAAQTGYTPGEVVFMRMVGMTDRDIVEKARSEKFVDPKLLKPIAEGDQVVVPSLGYKHGTVSNIDNPLKMVIQFDNGFRATLPEDQIFHAEALDKEVYLSTSPDKTLEDAARIRERLKGQGIVTPEDIYIGPAAIEPTAPEKAALRSGRPLTDDEIADHPDIAKALGIEQESRLLRARRRADAVSRMKAAYKEARSISPHDPVPKTPTELEEADLSFYNTIAQARQMAIAMGADESMIPPPAELERSLADRETIKSAMEQAIEIAELYGGVQIAPTPKSVEPSPPVTETAAPPLTVDHPVNWKLEDGRSIYEVEFGEYLYRASDEVPNLEAIKDSPARKLGFSAVSPRHADLYIKAARRMVKETFPDDLDEFDALVAKREQNPDSVRAADFEKFISKGHNLGARVAFSKDMEYTGIDDPFEAAQKAHRDATAQAVAEGRQVPQDSLERYPRLKQIAEGKEPMATMPTKQANEELITRGYTESQIARMNTDAKEWIISNDIDPKQVSILQDGRAVDIQDAPEENLSRPPGFDTAEGKEITDRDIAAEHKKETGIIDGIIQQLKDADPEAGFMQIPGGEAIKKLRLMFDRLMERSFRDLTQQTNDVVIDFERAINKWYAERKLGEYNRYRQEKYLRKIVKDGIKASRKSRKAGKGSQMIGFIAPRKGLPSKLGKMLNAMSEADRELAIVTLYRDDPEYWKPEFDKLSDSAKYLYEQVSAAYDMNYQRAKDAGILESFVDNYINRVYRDTEKKVMKIQYGVTGRASLKAKANFARRRKYKTIREAVEAGLNPILDPITLLGLYETELQRTIANCNLLSTLNQMQNEDGLPIIMRRPDDPKLLKTYRDQYKYLGIPGLSKWMYLKDVGGKPGFVKVEAKAVPYAAQRLRAVLAPMPSGGYLHTVYEGLRQIVMQLKLINPLIHLWNLASDYYDEFGFNPFKMLKYLKKAVGAWKNGDDLIKLYIQDGLNMRISREVGSNLYSSHYARSALLDLLPGPVQPITKPVRWLMQKSDEIMWQGTARYIQLGMAMMLTDVISQHKPGWTAEQCRRVASYYTNINLGLIPQHYAPWLSRYSKHIIFAPGWTLSNLHMGAMSVTAPFSKMGTLGISKEKYGSFGLASFTPEERRYLGKHTQWHLIKGILMLVFGATAVQLGWMALRNKLIDAGVIKDAKVEPRPIWRNPPRHRLDIFVGVNKRGQEIYIVPPLFRYIRDYAGYMKDPVGTVKNKMSVFLRMGIESITNYQGWIEKPIIPKGAPAMDKIKVGMTYFLETMLPVNYYAKREGRVPTAFEWVAPYTGTWIRTGSPGGRLGELYYEFMEWKQYNDDKIDKDISEALQRNDMETFMKLCTESGRYASKEGIVNRILRDVSQLYYLTQVADKRELIEFDEWLVERGKSPFRKTWRLEDIADGIDWEVEHFIKSKEEAKRRLEEKVNWVEDAQQEENKSLEQLLREPTRVEEIPEGEEESGEGMSFDKMIEGMEAIK